jgi:two-component system, OmpR family, heavy metal sensor histidine kinase CusS
MSPVDRKPRSTNRLHLVYFALAAFDIVTITATLSLSHRIMSAYEGAVQTSRDWAARASEIVELGDLAQQTNAPGNDVFDSGDVAAERARRERALEAFNVQYALVSQELQRNTSPHERAAIEAALHDVRISMGEMVARADDIFVQIGAGRADLAGRQMASMDRTYAKLTTAIAVTLGEMQSVQIAHLEEQIQIAQTLRRLEFIIVGLIFFIVVGVAIYGHHISQVMRRNTDEFNDMLADLERAYKKLQEYADNVAHELRSPVNKMLLASEIAIARARTNEEYAEALASNMEECQRLSSIVEGLLFLARATSTQVKLQREQVKIARELERIRSYFEASAADAGVDLALIADEALLAEVDRVLFQRAVTNLVANAIAHTPRGGAVLIRAEADSEGLAIEVADTGEGIALADQPHIFDRFYRADRARTSSDGRIGLGLPIAKSIVDLHGGRIALDSAPGRGARLTLHFPGAVSAAPALERDDSAVI